VVGHENIEAIIKTFGRAILDYPFAESFDPEAGAKGEAARSCNGNASDGHLTVGGELARATTAFRAMAIRGDGKELLDFGVLGQG
jgi:hypothetical protein